MTTEHHDLWADLPEWESRYNPGQILDWWREAAEFLAPLCSLLEGSQNEALQTALYSAQSRVCEQVERWDAQVWKVLDANMAEDRLTPFGEALAPVLERAGLTPRALLVEAGRIEEPNAEEILLRHMYGPPTEVKGGYMVGWGEPLELTDDEANAVSWALMGGRLGAPDPLSLVNRHLTRAKESLQAVSADKFTNQEEASRAQSLVAQAEQIVAAAEAERAGVGA